LSNSNLPFKFKIKSNLLKKKERINKMTNLMRNTKSDGKVKTRWRRQQRNKTSKSLLGITPSVNTELNKVAHDTEAEFPDDKLSSILNR
jgi:hypothetical protein